MELFSKCQNCKECYHHYTNTCTAGKGEDEFIQATPEEKRLFKKDDSFFKLKPFDHQLEVFNQIKDDPYFALFWEMGTGKTFGLIHVARYRMMAEPDLDPILVICPKAVTHNWAKEFAMFSPNPEMAKVIQVLEGTKKQRIEQLNEPGKKIFIINYEGVGRIKDIQIEMLKRKWGIMILDEAQRIKNHKAAQTKAVLKIGKKAKYRYVATGTPILNSMMDIFTIYLFLDGGVLFGENFYSFQNRYFIDENARWKGSPKYFPNWVARPGSDNEVQKKIYSCADRKLKEDCLDLPDKVFEKHYVEMDKEQIRMYQQIKTELITYFESEAVVASTALTKILRLNQITSGFIKIEGDEGETALRDISDTKIKALQELVADIVPAKVIIWAFFRNDIKRIQEALAKYNPVTIYGGTSNDARKHAIEDFQNDERCKVFIGQQRACGLGITLTAASYAIYFSQGYSLEDRLQSEDRCHRAGSEKHNKITYIDLVCRDTVDEVILDALRGKEDFAAGILDGKIKKLLGVASVTKQK